MRAIQTLSLAAVAAAASLAGQAQAGAPLVLDTQLVASGYTKINFVTHAPGDFDHLYIVEQNGRILKRNLTTGVQSTFMDFQSKVDHGGNEQGFLGLAFHPNYNGTGTGAGKFYVDYTALSPNNDTVIAEYTATGNPLVGDSASERRLMVINQDFSNHNGGWIGFSPIDGYLYIGMGDGGSGNDPNNRAQNLNQFLGKMLRIDVDGNNSGNGEYGIPASNPFVGVTGLDEIWAYGLRNPWRNSFDRETGDLWIGDVGQDRREEIDFQFASSSGGENYGWRCREGDIATPGVPACNPTPRVEPVYVYPHTFTPFRCTVVGGYVYRGCEIPELKGTYFCNEYCSNEIWIMKINAAGDGVTGLQQISGQIGLSNCVSFGEDAYGELYVVNQGGSDSIHKIIARSGATLIDCNENTIQDECEILDGSEADVDNDGIPDSCQIPPGCDGDANGDAVVDVNDISYVLFRLGGSGALGSVDGDVNCDGIVDVNDISYVLFRLGTCDPEPACP